MNNISPLELEVAQLMVEALNLDDIQAQDIDPEATLFRDGLGLDSIDALELALAISQKYGCQLRSDNPDNKKIFSSIRELSRYIEQKNGNLASTEN